MLRIYTLQTACEVRRTVLNVAVKMELLRMIFLGTLTTFLVSRIIHTAASPEENVRLHFGYTTLPKGSEHSQEIHDLGISVNIMIK
jgi:hypothetical protein